MVYRHSGSVLAALLTKPKFEIMKKLIILTLLLCFSTLAMSQTEYDRWRYKLGVTHMGLDIRYNDGQYNFSDLHNVGFIVGTEYYINPSLNAALNVSRGKVRHEREFRGLVTDADVRLTYKFNNGYIMKEDAFFAPYLSAGMGFTHLKEQEYFYDEFEGGHAMIPLAIGANMKVNDKTDVYTEAALKKSLDDSYNYTQFNIGVKFSLKKDKDSDNDGLIDRKDECPEVAGPSTNNGCPLADDDNDGVPNLYDACPTIPGSIDGCPDQDGDKVPDMYDVCPTKAGSPETAGCPDRDEDGVIDSQDPCPNKFGTMNGCTLEDYQNIAPESEESIKVQLIEAAENILFELDEATLTEGSYEPLKDILVVLRENPEIKLDINGHADSTGSSDYNMNLSQERAETVKEYFIENGIAESRLMAQGFGERAPRTDNDTSGERALNRRVDIDFIISNK